MAGESPDKSEQQKSSGETTPGERDPRLAVFRGAEARVEERGDDPGDDRVDQPTAVFTTVPSPAAAGDEAADEAPEAAGEAAEAPEAASDGEDARLRAAVAAWVSRAGRAEAEDDVSEGTDESDNDAEADADADEADVNDVEAAEAAEDTEGADTADDSVEPEAAAEDTEGADTADDSVEPEAAAEDAEDADAGDDSVEPEAEADSDDAPADADSEDSEDSEVEDDDEDDEDDEDSDSAPSEDDAPVDQPTAVFKKLPRPAVDQPTTALKIPPPPAKTVPGAEPAPKPESDAERTSKFVALRRDDVATPARPARPKAPAQPAAATPASLTEPERTKQQPLPPKPPLDLLAELTNTPPPAQTPVRTVLRRFKIWTPLAVLLLIVFAVVQLVRPLPEPVLTLTAKSEYTFDGAGIELPWPAEGQSAVDVEGVGSLGTHGAQEPAPIASVAKTMTAYVILKNHPIKGEETGPQIEVDQKADDESRAADESTAPIRKGQKFSEKQMLQLLMIPSGNNAARLLARWDSDSEAAFVEKMNAAAEELGMADTTYTDPSGLEKTTVSTATDQLKLAKAVMQYDVFREIVDTPDITIEGIDQKIYNNNNILLNPGVSGIKTGSSTPAGGNLLWSANIEVDGKVRRIYGAVFGIQRGATVDAKLQASLQDSLKLIKAAQSAVTSATVVKKGDVVGYVDDGLGGHYPVVATKDVKALGWQGLKVDLTISAGKAPIPHTAKAGTVVGEVSVGSGTGKASSPIVLQGDLVEPGFGAKLTRIA
ncbi:D-alanyl-D-alanine carboxypeptidase family protein [Streptomyces formicae]|uniref:D-alanyl-D-alanine carboxypeptidase n=1 Tax=Streptomyces formicae TaxID=1616117 RepID=A0ABY3WSY0_9ACTN|nr:serine hydrolase [Streptomyces formicae]UNM15706.1 D-alanyl-D-alanine carboxypeptidase [Streptomyces formicae]